MNQEKYIDDIREIRDIMTRSSRFLSLSGYSGIAAGICALLGAYAAYHFVYDKEIGLGSHRILLNGADINLLVLIAIITLVAALGTGIYFTTRETQRRKEKLWDHQTRRLLINMAIPLVAGGFFCLIILLRGNIGLMAPLTLIFYGLALVNASKYTLNEIRSLGLLEIGLGLLATLFIGYGLLFWAIGFGLLHIIYGIIMQVKYKS